MYPQKVGGQKDTLASELGHLLLQEVGCSCPPRQHLASIPSDERAVPSVAAEAGAGGRVKVGAGFRRTLRPRSLLPRLFLQ